MAAIRLLFFLLEALELRDNGIKSDILIFSKTHQHYLEPAFKNNLTLNVSSLDDIDIFESHKLSNEKIPNFHLKFDTGMTRLGINISDASNVFEELKEILGLNAKVYILIMPPQMKAICHLQITNFPYSMT